MSISNEPLRDCPKSFPPPDEIFRLRHRSAFSQGFAYITAHQASASASMLSTQHDQRRYIDDYSLRLIDDLINRPVDPLFMDARLRKHPVSTFSKWFTRIVVFIVCTVVGAVGFQFVRKLHADPRKAIRVSLANELNGQMRRFDSLVDTTTALRQRLDHESQRAISPEQSKEVKIDDMANGARSVQGSGIKLTIANSISASLDTATGALPRERKTHLRVVTDRDIQMFVSLLWQSGAEAICVNGNRLGVQTSIRSAGQSILIGVNQTQSPYIIEAIGDAQTLREGIESQQYSPWYRSLTDAGISPQLSNAQHLQLPAASIGDINFAKKVGK